MTVAPAGRLITSPRGVKANTSSGSRSDLISLSRSVASMLERWLSNSWRTQARRSSSNFIHISAVDRTDLFQLVDHPIYRCRTNTWINLGCTVIDFLAAGTVFFQNNVQKHQSLLGNPASTGF